MVCELLSFSTLQFHFFNAFCRLGLSVADGVNLSFPGLPLALISITTPLQCLLARWGVFGFLKLLEFSFSDPRRMKRRPAGDVADSVNMY